MNLICTAHDYQWAAHGCCPDYRPGPRRLFSTVEPLGT
jgi:hypothetical protein